MTAVLPDPLLLQEIITMTTYNLPIHCQVSDCESLLSDFQNLGYTVSDSESTIFLSGHRPVENLEQGLVLRQIRPDEKNEFLRFQKDVMDHIPNNLEDNICEALTDRELDHSLQKDVFLGLFQNNRLIASMLFIPHPEEWQNNLPDLDMSFPHGIDNVVIVDSILVGQSHRGYGIQHFLFRAAESWARSHGFPLLCGVASPKNPHSHANFLRSGYELVATKPKYHSIRNFYLRKL